MHTLAMAKIIPIPTLNQTSHVLWILLIVSNGLRSLLEQRNLGSLPREISFSSNIFSKNSLVTNSSVTLGSNTLRNTTTSIGMSQWHIQTQVLSHKCHGGKRVDKTVLNISQVCIHYTPWIISRRR
jgi:hypothetical protein